jgi:hypothetical protein
MWRGVMTDIHSLQHVDAIRVPSGNCVMIDGHFRPTEWCDAAKQTIPGVADIFFKQTSEFVFICVHFLQGRFGLVDVYLAEGDAPPVNLHASAKLGERVLQEATWSPWEWWNNVDWVANVSRVTSFQAMTFLPEDVRVFQIRRSRFDNEQWRVFFVLTCLKDEGQEMIVFPSRASDLNTDHWLTLWFVAGTL